MRSPAEVGNIVEELMIGEGGVGGVFSHLLFFSLETTFKSASSKQQRESPIDYAGQIMQ